MVSERKFRVKGSLVHSVNCSNSLENKSGVFHVMYDIETSVRVEVCVCVCVVLRCLCASKGCDMTGVRY